MNYFSEIVSIAVQEWDLVVAQWLAVLGSIPAPSDLKFSYIEPGESQRGRRLACSDGRGMGLNLGTA